MVSSHLIFPSESHEILNVFPVVTSVNPAEVVTNFICEAEVPPAPIVTESFLPPNWFLIKARLYPSAVSSQAIEVICHLPT